MITFFLTLPGLSMLTSFILLGHLLAYRGWGDLLVGWSPTHVSPFTGIIYIVLLVCSVLSHEIGHLAAALYRNDSSAKIYVELSPGLPVFKTEHNYARIELDANRYLLNLAGIATHIIFASLLGFVFFLTGMNFLPASVLLIDIAALASIVPAPGTDGFRFFLDRERERYLRENSKYDEAIGSNPKSMLATPRNIPSYPTLATGIFLSFLYFSISMALVIGIVGKWYGILFVEGAQGGIMISEAFCFAVLLAPPVVYAHWAIADMAFAIRFIRYLFKNTIL